MEIHWHSPHTAFTWKKSLYDILPKRHKITCVKLHDLWRVEFATVFPLSSTFSAMHFSYGTSLSLPEDTVTRVPPLRIVQMCAQVCLLSQESKHPIAASRVLTLGATLLFYPRTLNHTSEVLKLISVLSSFCSILRHTGSVEPAWSACRARFWLSRAKVLITEQQVG